MNKRRGLIATLTALILSCGILQPLVAHAATEVPYANISWSGVNLSFYPAGSFSQPITPKYDQSNISWFFHTPCTKGALCYSAGIADGHRAWTRVENTDQFFAIGKTKCTLVNANIYPEINKKSLDCMTPMDDFVVGNTYEFSLGPDVGDGRGNWWVASYRDKSNGKWFGLAKFRFDLTSQGQKDMQNFQLTNQINYNSTSSPITDCNKVPLGTTVFGKPTNSTSTNNVKYLTTTSLCVNTRIDEAPDGSGGKILNFGGSGSFPKAVDTTQTSSDIPGAPSGSTLGEIVRPSAGGYSNSAFCPAGSAITGLKVAENQSSPDLTGLKFVCSKINADGTTTPLGLEINFLDLMPSSGKYNLVSCKSGYAAISLNVATSAYVRDASITCASTLTYSAAAAPKVGSGIGYALNTASSCTPKGKLNFLTGIKGNTGAVVDSIQAVCGQFKTGISSIDTCLDKPLLALQAPFTGSEASVGNDLENVVRAGLKYYVTMHPKNKVPEIYLVDDQGDPTVATSIAPGVAINPCVIGIIGPMYSGTLSASLPSYSKMNLPFITPMATRPGLNLLPGASRIFHTTTINSDDYYSELIKFIVKDQKADGIQKPKVTIFSRNISSVLTTSYPNIDIDLVKLTDNSSTQEVLDAVNASKLKGTNAYVYDAYNGINDIRVINDAINAKLSANSSEIKKVYLTNVVSPNDAFVAAKSSANMGSSLLITEDIPVEVVNKTMSEFLTSNGTRTNFAATSTLDATLYFLEAFNSTSGTRSDIKDFINDKNNIVQGVSGPVSFDSNGKMLNKSVVGLNFATGKLVSNSKESTKTESSAPSNLNLTLLNGKIRITVDLPSINSKPLTSAFLIAPSIGYGAANKLKATILNGKATFAIPTKVIATKKSLPVQIYGSNSSGVSKTLESDLEIPESSKPSSATPKASKTPVAKPTSKNTSAPSAPTNPTYKLSGSHVIITVNAPSEAGAKPSKAYVRAPELGINSGNQIYGKLNSGKAIFDIPLTESMAGKTANISVYLSNEIGVSEPLSGEVNVPPVIPGLKPKTVVTPSKPSNQVTCLKGDLKRTFTAKQCPPGWIKK